MTAVQTTIETNHPIPTTPNQTDELIKNWLQDALIVLQNILPDHPHLPIGASSKDFIPKNIITLKKWVKEDYTWENLTLGKQRLEHIENLKKSLHI